MAYSESAARLRGPPAAPCVHASGLTRPQEKAELHNSYSVQLRARIKAYVV
ncbi:unnamed protein product [Penicillium roqueforti FM164]|uniref:Uncharacterized protein n=1 Tax=Penicillium roqueforti (strain FM164) TaxID=1365484 RepID=W6QLR6_PENRF|nr:unnamed protein product [Penicillium roqueforti FM164]